MLTALVAIVVVSIVLWTVWLRMQTFSATMNSVLAAATFRQLSEAQKEAVDVEVMALCLEHRIDFSSLGSLPPAVCYSLRAAAMARQGILPADPAFPRWFAMRNPFAVLTAPRQLAACRSQVESHLNVTLAELDA